MGTKMEGELVGGSGVGADAGGFGGDGEVFGTYLGGEKGTCVAEGVENVFGKPSRPLDDIVDPATGGDSWEVGVVNGSEDGVENASGKVIGAADARDNRPLGEDRHASTSVVPAQESRGKVDHHLQDQDVRGVVTVQRIMDDSRRAQGVVECLEVP